MSVCLLKLMLLFSCHFPFFCVLSTTHLSFFPTKTSFFSYVFNDILLFFSPPSHLFSVYQVLLQLLEMWSLPSMRLQWSWTGAGQRTVAGAGTLPSLSFANGVVVLLLMAAVEGPSVVSLAGAMFAFCQEPRASKTPQWRWPICWPTLTTPLRLKHRMVCHHWHPRWGSMPLLPSPPTKPVRCHNRLLDG